MQEACLGQKAVGVYPGVLPRLMFPEPGHPFEQFARLQERLAPRKTDAGDTGAGVFPGDLFGSVAEG